MRPSSSDVLKAISQDSLAKVIRGEMCVFKTPSDVNDDMLPTDHAELLEQGLYPLKLTHSARYVQAALETSLLSACSDALGVFCAHQCFYIQLVNEKARKSPISINRRSLPKQLAVAFLREVEGLHKLEVFPGDSESDRIYRVTLSGMHILVRDHGINWGMDLPAL